jgi:hypothetical protein
MSWIWRPTIVVPFCSTNSFAAAIICLPFSANGPVNGADNPILIASSPPALAPASASETLPTPVAMATASNLLANFSSVRWSTVAISSVLHESQTQSLKANGVAVTPPRTFATRGAI